MFQSFMCGDQDLSMKEISVCSSAELGLCAPHLWLVCECVCAAPPVFVCVHVCACAIHLVLVR